MNEYYTILEVEPSASTDEIKRSYRRLANKYHPDKSTGNDEKFKEISQAYDTLGDDDKRAHYDADQTMHHNSFNPFEHAFHQHGFAFQFNDMFHEQMHKNKDLTIKCSISLYDSFVGKSLEASYRLPSGKHETIKIDIPAGIESNVTIRMPELGDDKYPNVRRGFLNIQVTVEPDSTFYRVRDDLATNIEISPIESMIGCTRTVKDLLGNEQQLNIEPGMLHDTEFTLSFKGFKNVHTGFQGRFIAKVKIKSQPITDRAIAEQLKRIQQQLS